MTKVISYLKNQKILSDPMLTIDMEILSGRIMAASYHDRNSVEWPPHPTRLYSAFVAAYEENFQEDTEARDALEWLENLQPPHIYANPPLSRVSGRKPLTNYVPVNDKAQYGPKTVKKSKKIKFQPPIFEGISLNRLRAERSFPAFTPADPHVMFFYDVQNSPHFIEVLGRIAEQITYYGRSTTPVLVRVYESEGKPNMSPSKNGNIMLRVPGKGRLSHLEQVYRMRTQENMAVQPKVGQIVAYTVLGTQKSNETGTESDMDMRIFRLSCDHALPLSETYHAMTYVRNAFMSLYPGNIPEAVSGHTPEGRPSARDHMAVIPLPSAGYRYSDGHIMGFALVFQKSMPGETRESMIYTMNHLQNITMGRYGVARVEQISMLDWDPTPVALDARTYVKSSDTWATVTPAIFGKHPKRNQTGSGKDGGNVMEEACRMIGLPKPVEVRTGPASTVRGVPMARDFYMPDRFRKYYRSHMIIRFGREVPGPVIIGSGRFTGFGLCVPFKEGK